MHQSHLRLSLLRRLSSPDGKAAEPFRLLVVDLDPLHARAARAVVHPLHERADRRLVALEDSFDRAVGAVRDPPVHTAALGLPLR